MAITQQDRMDWAHHPVTEEFLQQLVDSKQDTMEAWAAEKFTAHTPEGTAVVNATALGGIRVLDQLIEKRLVTQLVVVFRRQFFGDTHHFGAHDFQLCHA